MRSISMRLSEMEKVKINIGYAGENEHTTVLIDCKKAFDEYPEAVASLTVRPPRGGEYPAVVVRNGNIVEWTVTDSDLIYAGNGEIQLTFTVGEVIVKTAIGTTVINRSLMRPGDIPTPIQNWIEQANQKIAAAEEATREAKAAAEHQPIIDDNGNWNTWNDDEGAYVDTGIKAQGEDGAPGHDGQDGQDGKDGKDGQDGAPGQDGTDATPDLITVPYSQLTFPVAKGTQCYQNGKLYEANQDIPTSEQWTAAHWTETTVEEQLRTQKSDILSLSDEKRLLSDDVKEALVELLSHVVFADAHGQDYLDSLVAAWTPEGSRYTIYSKLIATGQEYIMTALSEIDLEGCSFEYKAKPNSSTKNSGHIMSSSNCFVAFPKVSGSNLARVFSAKINGGTEATSSNGAWQNDTDVVVVAYADNLNSVTANSSTVIASVTAGENKSASNKFAICGYAGSASTDTYRFRGALYYIKVFDSSNNLIHHFVPAVDNETEKAGLYDSVVDVFYSSETATEFTVE